VFAGGLGLAPQHARQLGDTLFGVERGDFGDGPAGFDLLGGDVMSGGRGGDLGEVGDAKDLALPGNLPHLLSHGAGGLAPDVCIHFIEHQDWDLVLGGQDRFQGEHHAGQFAGGGDGPQGTRRLARVGGELKLDGIEPRAANARRVLDKVVLADGGQGRGEAALLEAEVGEFLANGLAELRHDFAAF